MRKHLKTAWRPLARANSHAASHSSTASHYGMVATPLRPITASVLPPPCVTEVVVVPNEERLEKWHSLGYDEGSLFRLDKRAYGGDDLRCLFVRRSARVAAVAVGPKLAFCAERSLTSSTSFKRTVASTISSRDTQALIPSQLGLTQKAAPSRFALSVWRISTTSITMQTRCSRRATERARYRERNGGRADASLVSRRPYPASARLPRLARFEPRRRRRPRPFQALRSKPGRSLCG